MALAYAVSDEIKSSALNDLEGRYALLWLNGKR